MCIFKAKPPTERAYTEWVRTQVGDIPHFHMPFAFAVKFLETQGIHCMLRPGDYPDANIYYTTEKFVAKMVPFLTYPADYYVGEFDVDCDDYSRWASADATRFFRVSGIVQCWGCVNVNNKQEYHAFNLSLTSESSYKLFEPNSAFPWAGTLFSRGDNSYEPDKWK